MRLIARKLLFLMLIAIFISSGVAAKELSTEVVRVVDGGTIVVKIDGQEEKVRLIGMDTPETVHPSKPVQPWGPKASAFTKSLLPVGRPIRLELDVEERDRYGRLLAYVYFPDGPMVNALLLAAGLAQVATSPPNVKYVDLFKSIQTAAREAGLGILGDDEEIDGYRSRRRVC